MDTSVTVKFGADTSELSTGANQAELVVSGLDARLGKLDKTLVRLNTSIKNAFGQSVDTGQTAETERLINALTKLEAKITNVNVKSAARRASQKQNVAANKEEGASLDALGEKADKAGKKMNPNGLGAKPGFLGLRPFELQNLSYQVNDFFTQIASGSSVMQASMQQSGQVFQIFQGQLMGLGRFIPVIGGVAVAVGLLVGGLMHLQTTNVMLREFTALLSLSADGGRYSAAVLAENARQLDHYGGSLDDAKKNLGLFIKEGVQADRLVEFGKAAQDLADVMKIDVVDASKEVGKAFTGNYGDIVELDDAINFLTDSEREHIRTMFESGDAQGARTEAFAIFQGQIQESAEYMRGPASEAARALETAWDGLMGRIANSSVIVQTMNNLRGLITTLTEALRLTGELTTSGSTQVAPAGSSRTYNIPGVMNRDFWRGNPVDIARRGMFHVLRPQLEETGAFSSAPSGGPRPQQPSSRSGPTQAQLKAESDLRLEYTRQAEAAGGLTAQDRLLRAEREGLSRAARAGLGNEASARVAAAARAAEQEKIDAESARRSTASGRRAAGVQEREAREAYRLAQDALRDRLEALDTEQTAAEDNFQRQLELQDQKLNLLKEFHGEESREYQSALQQRLRIQQRYEEQRSRLDNQRRAAEEQIAQIEADAHASAGRDALDMEADLIQRQVSARQLSAEAGIAALADIKRREIELEQRTAERIHQIRIAGLRAQLLDQSLSVVERDAINRRIEVMEAQHQAAMSAIQRQQSAVATGAVRDTTETIRSQWEGRVQPIGSALANLFTGAATGTQTLMMGLQGVGQAILGQVNEWVAQQVTAWLTGEAVKTAGAIAGETARTGATAAGVATRTGVEAAGAATTVAIEGGMTLASIGMAAVRAAAGAYAAIAGIPVIGPILAPLTAAAALAAVLALGSKVFSAEGGWGEVPFDGAQTVLHKKEMVLPAQYATPLRTMLTSSRPTGVLGGSMGGLNTNAIKDRGAMLEALQQTASRTPMSVSINTIDRRGMKRFIQEHSGDLQTALERRVRDLKASS